MMLESSSMASLSNGELAYEDRKLQVLLACTCTHDTHVTIMIREELALYRARVDHQTVIHAGFVILH